MFDFENLSVYKKSKELNKEIQKTLKDKDLDRITKDQLKRASLSVILNIAEGTGRFTRADKRNFYIRARGSLYECIAVLDVLNDEKLISIDYTKLYLKYEELSKMLLGLIKSQE